MNVRFLENARTIAGLATVACGVIALAFTVMTFLGRTDGARAVPIAIGCVIGGAVLALAAFAIDRAARPETA